VASELVEAASGVPVVNPLWDAAQALLALVQECLGDLCVDYPRVLIETSTPVEDCTQLAIVIGPAKAFSGSCVGRGQMYGSLEVHITRCCEPVGDLNSQSGYTPPTPEQITAAVACLTRDAWAMFECIVCQACDTIGAVRGVTACCDNETGPPEILFRPPSGGCRTAIVRIPLVFTTCCPPPAEPGFQNCVEVTFDAETCLVTIVGTGIGTTTATINVTTNPGDSTVGINPPQFLAPDADTLTIDASVYLAGATELTGLALFDSNLERFCGDLTLFVGGSWQGNLSIVC